MNTKDTNTIEREVKSKDCANCGNTFSITSYDQDFYERVDVPEPQACPDCRQQRRLAYNNEMNLYHRKCDLTGESIISIHSPDKPYKVYKQEIWWSDKWDATEYGRDYDFTKPFFEQFMELAQVLPFSALHTNYLIDENSDYTNYAGSNKDCYLIFHADYNRDCYYGYGVKKCENVLDVYNVFDSQLCYECIDCQNCYNLSYSQNCLNCHDSIFLKDCVGCHNCIASKNLHRKQYYIFNEKHTKKSYQAFLQENPWHSRQTINKLQEASTKLCLKLPNRSLRMIQVESSYGDHLFNCKNTCHCHNVSDMEDGKFCYQVYKGAKDCMDYYQYGNNSELVYDSSIVGYNTHMIRFCHCCSEQINNLTYCQYCAHSSNLFGCIGLRQKSYCILNKEYTKKEYQDLLPKIVSHMTDTKEWGEFFPISNSPFAYNETTAQQYYPLTQEQAIKKGYQWKEDETMTEYQGVEYEIPDSIHEAQDDITKAVLLCKTTKKPYKIIPQELEFYRKMGLPIALCCPNQRHLDRLNRRNPRKLWKRFCEKCGADFHTTYAPDKPELVYCEDCYAEEVE